MGPGQILQPLTPSGPPEAQGSLGEGDEDPSSPSPTPGARWPALAVVPLLGCFLHRGGSRCPSLLCLIFCYQSARARGSTPGVHRHQRPLGHPCAAHGPLQLSPHLLAVTICTSGWVSWVFNSTFRLSELPALSSLPNTVLMAALIVRGEMMGRKSVTHFPDSGHRGLLTPCPLPHSGSLSASWGPAPSHAGPRVSRCGR